jgi:hypothetical protein
MVEGRLNGYPVICASLDKPENEPQQCSDETMLWTLLPEDDPQKVIKKIGEINKDRRADAISQNDAMVTSASDEDPQLGVDVDNLIRNAPVRIAPERENHCLFGPCPNE